MANANACHIPTTRLDQECVRIALENAHDLIANGYTAEDAAQLACRGSWAEFYGYVVQKLRAEPDHK